MRRLALLLLSLVALSLGGDVCTNEGEHRCLNGGVCVKTTDQVTGAVQVSCTCPAGTSGARCESEGACDLQCQHGGSCRPRGDNDAYAGTSLFACDCLGLYKGLECEIPFANCPMNGGPGGDAAECLWGGTCVADEGTGKFACDCPAGRSGNSCEREASGTANAPDGVVNVVGACRGDEDCYNGGLCVRAHDAAATAAAGVPTKRAQCLCALGWGGDVCARPCTALACQHGSSCRFSAADNFDDDMDDDGAHCACDRDRFRGRECEIAVQKCPGIGGVECLHGGGCVAVPGAGDFYTCACPPGRAGARCEAQDSAVTATLFVPQEDEAPIVFIIAVVAVALLIFLPITVIIVLRSHERKAEVQRCAAAGSNGKETAHDSTGAGSNESAEQPNDGQFV